MREKLSGNPVVPVFHSVLRPLNTKKNCDIILARGNASTFQRSPQNVMLPALVSAFRGIDLPPLLVHQDNSLLYNFAMRSERVSSKHKVGAQWSRGCEAGLRRRNNFKEWHHFMSQPTKMRDTPLVHIHRSRYGIQVRSLNIA